MIGALKGRFVLRRWKSGSRSSAVAPCPVRSSVVLGHVRVDPAQLRSELGFRPRTPFKNEMFSKGK